MLLLPLPEVRSTLNQLISAQGFLGPLAADPSLRGVMNAMDTAMVGVQHGQASLAQLDKPMSGLADALGKVASGQPAWFSWEALFSSGPHTRRAHASSSWSSPSSTMARWSRAQSQTTPSARSPPA